MADEVRGVAVLEERSEVRRLYIPCCREGRKMMLIVINVRPRGTPHPPGEPCWEFDFQGDRIHVTPSVRCTTRQPPPGDPDAPNDKWVDVELFHNGADWTVPFVRNTEGSAYRTFCDHNGVDFV